MKKILNVEKLSIGFAQSNNSQPLINELTYHVNQGEVLGVVGESGSGKSLSTMALLGLLGTSLYAKGGFIFDGVTYDLQDSSKLKRLRGSGIGMIFQDARSSLNPIRTIGATLVETLRCHVQGVSKIELKKQAVQLLADVGIGDCEKRMKQYPYQLSGGLCQRVMIALALAARPKLLIADEPTTALDTTVQAQILDLIETLLHKTDMSVIFISHDLAVVSNIADRVMVMRDGHIVEVSSCNSLFNSPSNEYTKRLLGAVQQVIPSEVEQTYV